MIGEEEIFLNWRGKIFLKKGRHHGGWNYPFSLLRKKELSQTLSFSLSSMVNFLTYKVYINVLLLCRLPFSPLIIGTNIPRAQNPRCFLLFACFLVLKPRFEKYNSIPNF